MTTLAILIIGIRPVNRPARAPIADNLHPSTNRAP